MLSNTLASLLALALTGAALAQESAIVGPSRPDAIDGRVGAKLVFTAVGQPDDVAGVVAFLLSDAARFLNGVEIPIDAGFTAKAQ